MSPGNCTVNYLFHINLILVEREETAALKLKTCLNMRTQYSESPHGLELA